MALYIFLHCEMPHYHLIKVCPKQVSSIETLTCRLISIAELPIRLTRKPASKGFPVIVCKQEIRGF
jgi:hypothetical protein